MVQVNVDGESVTIDTPTDAPSILRAAGLHHAERYDLLLLGTIDGGTVIPRTMKLTPRDGTQFVSARKSTTAA